jgi:Polysaccharide lyase
MRYLYCIFLFATISSSAQRYFYEDFNYASAKQMDSLYEDGLGVWSTLHAMPDTDINQNGIIDSIEKFKKTTIVDDPLRPDNKVIRLELNKVDPYFYSKYFCNDYDIRNVLLDSVLNINYEYDKRLYCVDCTDSPMNQKFATFKTHMNRNEINTYAQRRYMYKAQKDNWFGVQMLVDNSYQLDSIKSGEIVSQFHLPSDKGRNPPIALLIANGRFKLVIIKNNDGKSDSYDLGPVVKNEWIDWKWHVVLSRKDKHGIVEVWRNGVQVASVKGKNAHKNIRTYFKIGVYKWGWWDCGLPYNYSKKKVIYFDKIWANRKDEIRQ